MAAEEVCSLQRFYEEIVDDQDRLYDENVMNGIRNDDDPRRRWYLQLLRAVG